jgi:hypothetical protein
MASYHKPNVKGFIAGEDLSAKQYHFVKLSDEKTVVAAAANERAIGILLNKPTSGQGAEVALPGGGAKLKLAEAVTVGKLLTSTATGQGEIADAAGEWCAAMAHQGGAEGDIIAVMVIAMNAHDSDA